ncbi:hypothetical protein [Streptomyces sp. NPDC046979]|uniref:hypothetical protein n=1 Tax=Streptomyces sp. NPDC046979 TaxID=3154604 RepID=UPI0033EB6022
MPAPLYNGKPFKTPLALRKALERAVGPGGRKALREYHADLEYRARVSRVVDQAPPLTDRQRARIRVLFMGSGPYVTR